jgi:putative tricarboxylic transport membrane protein
MPLILAFCIIGAFALNNRMFDVWVMLGFGLLGFFLESKNIPLAPFVIGFVLGPIAEENLTIALLSETPIFSRPISIVFIAVAVFMLLLPIFKKMRNQSKMTSA